MFCFSFRSPVSEFLLSDGQSQCWLLGNKLITITTSGGSGAAGSAANTPRVQYDKEGIFKGAFGQSRPEMIMSGRRRHKSAAVKSISETVILNPHSKDDLLIHRQSSPDERSDSDLSGTRSPQDEGMLSPATTTLPRTSVSLDSSRTEQHYSPDMASGKFMSHNINPHIHVWDKKTLNWFILIWFLKRVESFIV